MSAVKSKQVVGYDQGGLIVHFVDGSRKSLSSCVKNELIAVCNYRGIKFVGNQQRQPDSSQTSQGGWNSDDLDDELPPF